MVIGWIGCLRSLRNVRRSGKPKKRQNRSKRGDSRGYWRRAVCRCAECFWLTGSRGVRYPEAAAMKVKRYLSTRLFCAFTLIELLVVVAIIAILAAMLLP